MMGRIASVLACDKDRNLIGPKGNIFLNEVQKKIDTLSRAHQFVAHAATIPELADALETSTRAGRPNVIQIIGHAEPGVLLLEQYWTGDYRRKDNLALYCALDSNPHCYAALGDTVGPPTEVWLLGCNVGGEQGPIGVDARRGATAVLIFALEQLWGTKVWASQGSVNADHFAHDGVYRGPLVGFERVQYSVAAAPRESSRRATQVTVLAELWPSAAPESPQRCP